MIKLIQGLLVLLLLSGGCSSNNSDKQEDLALLDRLLETLYVAKDESVEERFKQAADIGMDIYRACLMAKDGAFTDQIRYFLKENTKID